MQTSAGNYVAETAHGHASAIRQGKARRRASSTSNAVLTAGFWRITDRATPHSLAISDRFSLPWRM